jgi:hypothetical protein
LTKLLHALFGLIAELVLPVPMRLKMALYTVYAKPNGWVDGPNLTPVDIPRIRAISRSREISGKFRLQNWQPPPPKRPANASG